MSIVKPSWQEAGGRLFEFAKNLIGFKIAELGSRLKCEFDIFVRRGHWAQDCLALMARSQSNRCSSSLIKVYTQVHRLALIGIGAKSGLWL